MLYRRPNRELLAELRYTLEVMEEDSHRGLDDKAAEYLRGLLLRRIAQVEEALARETVHSLPNPAPIAETPE